MCRVSWSRTGPGRTFSPATAGRSSSTGWRPLLRAGLLDEVRIHLVPVLLGAGTPLFAGERAELVPEGEPVQGTVTHLRYLVGR
ncbi:dihydrofolate reductase family protein [Nonomuraea sp. SBT364]|uniref:dihydrofolate reductase family protein n=1 Tax=Nonomuraea sp. SBT364 TaxID=1580530 RepID=UPI000A49D6D7|nr:dihydrofolate reductase family protein [Nonomuraea sp. SBT364]